GGEPRHSPLRRVRAPARRLGAPACRRCGHRDLPLAFRSGAESRAACRCVKRVFLRSRSALRSNGRFFMFNYVLKKIVGTKNQRELKRMAPLVQRINEREGWAKALSDEQMREQIHAWRKEVADVPEKEKSAVLNRILPDSFALTREASVRSLGMRHFDVQLIGGMGLHKGMIAEMK